MCEKNLGVDGEGIPDIEFVFGTGVIVFSNVTHGIVVYYLAYVLTP